MYYSFNFQSDKSDESNSVTHETLNKLKNTSFSNKNKNSNSYKINTSKSKDTQILNSVRTPHGSRFELQINSDSSDEDIYNISRSKNKDVS